MRLWGKYSKGERRRKSIGNLIFNFNFYENIGENDYVYL